MKKFFLLAGLLLCFLPSNAQKLVSGSLEPVFKEKKLNVVIDYSQAVIDGVKESSLLNVGGERAKDWIEGKDELLSKFLLAMLPIVDQHVSVGRFEDAKYTFTFYPKSIDEDGEVRGDAAVTDAEGNEVAVITKINGDGGRWGSFINLCGDSFTRAGTSVGKFMDREYDKIAASKRGTVRAR
jgi:hypothetical protein